jgi:hypothetical protein
MNTSEVPVIGCDQIHELIEWEASDCDICHRINDLSTLCSDDFAGIAMKTSPIAMAEEADRLLHKMVS